MDHYICKVADIQEMNERWDQLIAQHPSDTNWILWKESAVRHAENGQTIPYYGKLSGEIICEATAMLDPGTVQNGEGLADEKTAYLSAFRTEKPFRGKGYFSALFRFMIDDLRKRGFEKVTVGVESGDVKNRELYAHFGFDEYIKTAAEIYPDATEITVEYYAKNI